MVKVNPRRAAIGTGILLAPLPGGIVAGGVLTSLAAVTAWNHFSERRVKREQIHTVNLLKQNKINRAEELKFDRSWIEKFKKRKMKATVEKQPERF